MRRHIEVENLARTDFHRDKDVQKLEPNGDNGEEVGRNNGLGMVLDERRPTLRRMHSTRTFVIFGRHVLSHRSW
jgi:hypothetical protein